MEGNTAMIGRWMRLIRGRRRTGQQSPCLAGVPDDKEAESNVLVVCSTPSKEARQQGECQERVLRRDGMEWNKQEGTNGEAPMGTTVVGSPGTCFCGFGGYVSHAAVINFDAYAADRLVVFVVRAVTA